MNKSAQPDGTENKLKWIHSDGFLSDFCCGNLILLRNRFYGYSFLLFHLHLTICDIFISYFYTISRMQAKKSPRLTFS